MGETKGGLPPTIHLQRTQFLNFLSESPLLPNGNSLLHAGMVCQEGGQGLGFPGSSKVALSTWLCCAFPVDTAL